MLATLPTTNPFSRAKVNFFEIQNRGGAGTLPSKKFHVTVLGKAESMDLTKMMILRWAAIGTT